MRVTNTKASLTLLTLRKMTELAKEKQTSFSTTFRNVPNTNEASSSESTPLLNNASGTSKAKKRAEPELNSIFEIKTVI